MNFKAFGNFSNSVYTNTGAWEGPKVYVGSNMTGFGQFFPSKTGKYRFLPVLPGFPPVDRDFELGSLSLWALFTIHGSENAVSGF